MFSCLLFFKLRISVLSVLSSSPDLFVSLSYSLKTPCILPISFLQIILTSSAKAAPLNLKISLPCLISIPLISFELFIFLSSGSMQMMKMAQLRASPCLTPLSIFRDSLRNPFIKILAVMFLYNNLKIFMKPTPKP